MCLFIDVVMLLGHNHMMNGELDYSWRRLIEAFRLIAQIISYLGFTIQAH